MIINCPCHPLRCLCDPWCPGDGAPGLLQSQRPPQPRGDLPELAGGPELPLPDACTCLTLSQARDLSQEMLRSVNTWVTINHKMCWQKYVERMTHYGPRPVGSYECDVQTVAYLQSVLGNMASESRQGAEQGHQRRVQHQIWRRSWRGAEQMTATATWMWRPSCHRLNGMASLTTRSLRGSLSGSRVPSIWCLRWVLYKYKYLIHY